MKIILFLFLFIPTLVNAAQIDVVTGYAFYVDKNNIICEKAQLPKGQNKIDDKYQYVEVDNKDALDKVHVGDTYKIVSIDEVIYSDTAIYGN